MTKKCKCNLFAACKKQIAAQDAQEPWPFAFCAAPFSPEEMAACWSDPCVSSALHPSSSSAWRSPWSSSSSFHTSIRMVELMSPIFLSTFPWKNFNPQFQTQNFCGAALSKKLLGHWHLLTWIDIGSNCHDWSRHPSLKGCDVRSLGQGIRNKASHDREKRWNAMKWSICRCKNPWFVLQNIWILRSKRDNFHFPRPSPVTGNHHFAPAGTWTPNTRKAASKKSSPWVWSMLGYAWIQWYTRFFFGLA